MHGARVLLLALLLSSTSLAGCLGGGDDDPPARPPPTGRGPDVPPSGPPPLEARVPDLLVGQWWQWSINHRLHGDSTVRTVVASTSPTLRIGATDLDAGLLATVFHFPPQGTLDPTTMAWMVHDAPATLVQFPITDGKSWQGTFSGQTATFTAREVEVEGVAGTEPAFQVTSVGPTGGPVVDFTWSVLASTFLSLTRYGFDGEPFVTLRLTDMGFAHGAPVHVIENDEVYLAGVNGPNPAAPAPPATAPTRFTVPPEATHTLFASFLGGAEGVYLASYTPPTGQPVTARHENPPGSTANTLVYEAQSAMPGEWTAQLSAIGTGGVFAEVFAATVEEVTPG